MQPSPQNPPPVLEYAVPTSRPNKGISSWQVAIAAVGLTLFTLMQSELSSSGRTYNGMRLLSALAAVGCVALFASLSIDEDASLPRWKAVLMRVALLGGGGAVVVAYLMYQPPRSTAGDYSLANPFIAFAGTAFATATAVALVGVAVRAVRRITRRCSGPAGTVS